MTGKDSRAGKSDLLRAAAYPCVGTLADREVLEQTAVFLRGRCERLAPGTASRRFHERLLSLTALESGNYK